MLWRLLQCVVLGLSASVLFGLPSLAKDDIIRQDDDERRSDGERIYVLCMFWLPSLCFTDGLHGGEVSEACYYPRSYWTTHLTAHGLWPEYETGDWPSFCNNEKFDVAKATEAVGLERMEDMWPSVSTNGDADLWEHEWKKHGSCTNLSQEQYFSWTLDLIDKVGTPQSLVGNIGKNVSQEDIQAFYGEFDVELTCKDNVLMEVRLCFNRGKDGEIEDRIDCPGKTSTCQDTIHIPYFNQRFISDS